ncbi:acetyl/propionyl/methylcrotonyl-CoA carboxylase subunit alpha [Paracraurococcus lichenis]|uniref:Biotin carboxylase N-terminal domain-containing protein n=1 Tax=Paracraurococcus lichenis TaxID=3064888 RepID=A0ABT9DSX2_9PROT|nr:biotin carboxylase N-terminal domain-containing protein [Paracraurococcus sp. LOR1-02]MDO9706996.1 biotin carboxylase N-terminal domain-containing protein [Paracraurococcus sp. LOR1-02]
MFRTLLIGNRGEIACRVIRTARRMGIRTVAVFSEADARAQHVALADEAYPIGPARAADSYLRIDRILAAARASGAEAIHPGYGFLSENADFAEACAAAGIAFLGPPPAAIRAMGSKAESKRLMEQAGVPVVPGYHGEQQDEAFLADQAARIGFPVLIKASAGGGGKGMRPVLAAADFAAQLAGARREAKAAFGDDRVLLERYLQKPRHVEVQVFADTQGHAIHLHTRDCSVQRRHQKVLEEAPAPDLSPALRARLHAAAIAAARAVGYVSAGTVEFIVEGEDAFFMEMNTRLQVEHPVTEMVTGLDLVEWQIRVAAGEPLPLREAPAPEGHSVEVRLYAEDPAQDFRPSTGPLRRFALPAPAPDLRIESGVVESDAITPFYDPMIAKLVAWGPDRGAALARLGAALGECRIAGITSNLGFLQRLVAHPAMRAAELDTGFAGRFAADLQPPPRPAPALALAAAALEAILPATAAPPADPWDRRDGWRLQGAGSQLVHLADGEALHRLRLSHAGAGWRLALDGAETALSGRRLDGGLQVTLGEAVHRIPVLRDGDAIQVLLPEGGWTLRLLDPHAPPGGEASAQGRLSAPIPGRVVQVLVTQGEAVSRGQVLAVLEAMKTELRITAPADGVVAHIGCAAGDTVEEGTEIVTLTAAE